MANKKQSWSHEAGLRVPVYTYLASVFLGLTVLLFVVVGIFAISRGRIFLTLKTDTIPLDFFVSVKPTPGPGEIFGFVREVLVSGEETATIPQDTTIVGKAKGSVTIINVSGSPQPLVATTRLLSPDKVLFRIAKNVVVPAKGQIIVEAAADQAGKQGEIGPTSFTIPGLKPARQKEVYAKSSTSMVASSETTSALTQELIDQTTKTLKNKLLKSDFNSLLMQ